MRVRKSFLPGALLRSFSGSSTGQGVGIICQQTEEEFSGCESLLSLSQTFFNWHGMCIYRPGDTSKEKRCPHGREHMEKLCKKIMDEKDPRRLMTLVEALNKEFHQREQELRSRRQHPVAQSCMRRRTIG